jgi:MFS family permease
MLRRLAVDTTPLRESRDLRLLIAGTVASGIGTQAALVALPYQVYVQTGSATLTGLLGAVELVPLVAMALAGGAIADHFDRRKLLLIDQVALVAISGTLAAAAFVGHPPLGLLYVLAGALAGFGAVQNVARSAIVPNLVRREHLSGALALNFGLMQLTMVVGPLVGGFMIGALGVAWPYVLDAATCLVLVVAALQMSAQPPQGRAEGRLQIGRSIADGLRFVRSSRPLVGSFAIDLAAMTFGMPRALFPVLAISVYGAGAAGTGALFAAVSAGALVAALTTGWVQHVNRVGLVVVWAVVVWGLAIAAAGLVGSLAAAIVLLAVAGAADSISAVCRSIINQSVTPDHLRGRMSSVFSLVVTSGPRLGDVESGVVAGLAGVRFSVVSGGLACVVSALAIAAAFPSLVRFRVDDAVSHR